jgi:hypothetical protein
MELRRVYISATRPIRAEDGLSPQLGDALQAWRQEAEGWIGAGLGDTPGPSETRLRAWVEEGEALADRVRAELGDDVYVEFLPRHQGWSGRWPHPHEEADLWSPPPGPCLPPPPPPPAQAVLDAVRAVIAREVERVDDPVAGVAGGDPSDVAGWHPGSLDGPPGGPGRPSYDAETWRHFELVDLAYIDEMVLVEFAWTDPTTPDLRYLIFCHVDQLTTAESAGLVVRSQLRSALAPGWRERLAHDWLSRRKVLLRRNDDKRALVLDEHCWNDPR